MVVGGIDHNNSPTSTVELYYPASQCTIRLRDAPIANSNPILCNIGGTIYLGINSARITMYKYDFAADNWVNLGPDAVSINDHGRDSFTCRSSSIFVANDDYPEVFDVTTKKWTSYNFIETMAGVGSCVAETNGIVYSFGGSKTASSKVVQYLNLATNKWTVSPAKMSAYTQYSGCSLVPGNTYLT